MFLIQLWFWICVVGQSILTLNTSAPSNPQGQTAIVDVSVQTGGAFDATAQGGLTLQIVGSNAQAYFWASSNPNVNTTLVQGRATVLLTSNYVENVTVRISYSNVSVSSGGVQTTSTCNFSFVADTPRVLWMDSLGTSDGLYRKHMVVDSQRYVYLTLASTFVLQKRSPAHQVVWTQNMSSLITGLALSPDESAVYAIANGLVFKLNSNGTLLWNVSNGPLATLVPTYYGSLQIPVNDIVVTPANQVICVGERYFGSALVIMWQLDPDNGEVVANLTQNTTGNVMLHRVQVDSVSGSVWAYGSFDTTCIIGNQTINYIYFPNEAFLIQVFPVPNTTARGLALQVSTVFQVAFPDVTRFSVPGVSLEVDVYGDVVVAIPLQTGGSGTAMKILKYSRGTVLWVNTIGGGWTSVVEHTSLVSDSTGNLYLAMTLSMNSWSSNGLVIPFVSVVTSDPKTSNVLKIARDSTLFSVTCFATPKASFVKKLAIERSTNFILALGDVLGNMTFDTSVAIDTGVVNAQFLAAITPSISEYPLAGPQRLIATEDTPLLITLSGSYFQQSVGPGVGFRGRIDKLPVNGNLFTVANGSLGVPIVTIRTILVGLDLWYVPLPHTHSGFCRSGLCNGTETQPSDSFEYSMIAFGAVSLTTARIDIVVSAVPSAPVANAQVVDAAENVVSVITLTGTAFDGPPHGPDLSLSAVITRAPPSSEGSLYQFDLNAGSLLDVPIPATSTYVRVSNTQNQILYLSPNNQGNFSTQFEFVIFDGLLNSSTSAKVIVNVRPINQRPTAEDQGLASNSGRILLRATDTDNAASLLRFFIVDLPKQGQLFQCDAAGGKSGQAIDTPRTLVTDSTHCVFYESAAGSDRDQFAFVANDGQLDSTTARVTIGTCPPGLFLNMTNSECRECERGRFSSAPDQPQCSPCMASYYQLQDGQPNCEPCPSNVDVCAGEVVIVSANYWAVTSSAAKVVPVQCLPKMCLGDNMCSENRAEWNQNPLCGKCLPGYSEWGPNCIDCRESNGGSTFLVLLICLVAILILRWAASSVNARAADGLICAYFIQCGLLLVGPSENSALSFLNFFDFSFADAAVPVFGVSCPFYIGPQQKFGLNLGLVFLLLADLGFVMLCHYAISRRLDKPFGRPQIDGYIRAACTLFLLAFNKITQMCIQYLSCKDTGVSRVVVTQPGIECTTTAYATYLVLVSAGLAICFLVGPGFIFYLFTQKKAGGDRYFELVKSTYDAEPSEEAKRFETRWGSFFAAFDKHAFWYQLVILARRTSLIIFDAALVNDPQARSVMMLFATLSFLFLHLYVQPYRPPVGGAGQTSPGSTASRLSLFLHTTVTSNRLETASLFLHLVISVLIAPYQVYPAGVSWITTLLIWTFSVLFLGYLAWRYALGFKSKLSQFDFAAKKQAIGL